MAISDRFYRSNRYPESKNSQALAAPWGSMWAPETQLASVIITLMEY